MLGVMQRAPRGVFCITLMPIENSDCIEPVKSTNRFDLSWGNIIGV